MDKSVVRESKFRHAYGKPWRKEACITNIQLGQVSGSNLIKANGLYIAVPWQSASGALAIIPLAQSGKVPDRYPVIDAHPSSLLDFDFNPMHDNVIATCSRETVIKLWQIPEQGISSKMTQPAHVLSGHTNRVVTLTFHPIADNLLLSTAADKTYKLWDLTANAEALSIEAPDDVVQSVVWNEGGTLFATSCVKDKKLRIYDPRQNKIVAEKECHEGGKGFNLTFLENDRILTVGFSKTSQRQVSLWDLESGNLNEAISTTQIDVNPGILFPFYDAGTGIAALAGRGDELFFYEVNNDEPFVHPLSKSKCTSYNGTTIIPKRFCDVKQCEIMRFLNITKTTIEPVSVLVPRKNSTTVFQEDIFPPVPAGVPALSAADWIAGANAPPVLTSMQPPGMASVYQLSKEEGGKDAMSEERKRLRRAASRLQIETTSVGDTTDKPPQTEGYVRQYTGGWWNPWTRRWLSIVTPKTGGPASLQVYEQEESAKVLLIVPIDATLQEITVDEYNETDFSLTCIDSTGATVQHRFQESDASAAQTWVSTIRSLKERPPLMRSLSRSGSFSSGLVAPSLGATSKSQSLANMLPAGGLQVASKGSSFTSTSSLLAASAAATPSSSMSSSTSSELVDEISHSGFLEIFQQGGWLSFSSWQRRWWLIKGQVLYGYRSENTKENPLENFHLARVISVAPSENVAANKEWTLKLCTATQVLHLAAANEADRDAWIVALNHAINGDDPMSMSMSMDTVASDHGPCEAYVQKKRTGLFSLARAWDRRWMSAAKKDILYFKDHVASAPIERISVQMIKAVVPGAEELDFEFRMADRTVVLHKAETVEDRDHIVAQLEFLRKQFVNLYELYGITEDEASGKTDFEGMNFVDPTEVKKGNQPVLMQVKGRRRIRVEMVACSYTSLDPSTVFVLDVGTHIYQWNGACSPRVAKGKGLDLASKIRQKERGGVAEYIVLDQGKQNESHPGFWSVVGGSPSKVPRAIGEELQHDEEPRPVVRIYRVLDKDVEERFRIKLIHEGSLPPCELLYTGASAVVDCGNFLYVWIGKESTSYQRKLAAVLAKKLYHDGSRTAGVAISRLIESGETILFKEQFSNFPGMLPINLTKKELKSNVAQAKTQEAINVATLHNSVIPEHWSRQWDDASGDIFKMWRVEDFGRVELPREEFAELFSGESYVIVYRFMQNNKESNLVYFWQGVDSSRSEKGTSAYMTVDVSSDLADAEQVRVEQLKENLHFLRVYQSKFANFSTLRGKRQEYDFKATALFRIVGDEAFTARPVEVSASARSLHSRHAFVVRATDSIFVWQGVYATDVALEKAVAFANAIAAGRPVQRLLEGNESAVFWKALNGKDTYYQVPRTSAALRPARLFLLSGASGSIKVEECFQFTQSDLDNNHIALLDCFNRFYVWFGPNSPVAEKKMAMRVALDYIRESPLGHDANTPIQVIDQCLEPLAFTAQFVNWTNVRAYHRGRDSGKEVADIHDVLGLYETKTYSFEELLQDPLPVGVDPTKLEAYLSDQEFERVFAMTRDDYVALPLWKAEKLKQDIGLF